MKYNCLNLNYFKVYILLELSYGPNVSMTRENLAEIAIFTQLAISIFMRGCSITAAHNKAEKLIRDVKGYGMITCFHCC